MRVRFWGVRGSVPASLSPAQVKERISAVVQRIAPQDLVSADSRERFLARLPGWLFGTAGGHTSCIEIGTENRKTCLLLNAGTGLGAFSRELERRASSADGPGFPEEVHILLPEETPECTQGIPFFFPLTRPETQVFFLRAADHADGLENVLRPPFPGDSVLARNSGISARVFRQTLPENGSSVYAGGAEIVCRHRAGNACAFRITAGDSVLLYCAGAGLSAPDLEDTEENRTFFGGADAVILDTACAYGEKRQTESGEKPGSLFAVDFAGRWDIRRLILFRHSPACTDKTLHTVRQTAEAYQNYAFGGRITVSVAAEEQEWIL